MESKREQDDPLGVRQALRNTNAALEVFDATTPSDLGVAGAAAGKPAAGMLAVLTADVAKARAAFSLRAGAPVDQLTDDR
ncbi:MAG: hypothetical protein R3D52_07725 [Xanthobacteraceae bacterium]